MLLDYAAGETVSAIAGSLNTNRQKADRCVRKALEVGALAALDDLPRTGHLRLLARCGLEPVLEAAAPPTNHNCGSVSLAYPHGHRRHKNRHSSIRKCHRAAARGESRDTLESNSRSVWQP